MAASTLDSAWEGQFERGALLWNGPIPATPVGLRRSSPGCGQPDRVVFLFDPMLSDTFGAGFDADLEKVVGLIQLKHPTVEQVDLVLLVGSEAHDLCPSPDRKGPFARASETHAKHADLGWAHGLADRLDDVSVGPERHVPCSRYADHVGHLTAAGITSVGTQMREWYE